MFLKGRKLEEEETWRIAGNGKILLIRGKRVKLESKKLFS